MEYTFRKAIEQDVPKIIELHGLLADYHCNIDSYWKSGTETKVAFGEYIKNEISKPNVMFLIVEFDNRIIGYFSAEINPTNPSVSVAEIGYISNGFILEEFRGKGISKMAIEKFMAWFKENGIKIMELGVASENVEGVRAWKGLGFKEYMKKMKMNI